MRVCPNKQRGRRDHWQNKPGSGHQACRSDPAGNDDFIGLKAVGIRLDANDMTGTQMERAHRSVRNDRRANVPRCG
jgi:hypothetical protein